MPTFKSTAKELEGFLSLKEWEVIKKVIRVVISNEMVSKHIKFCRTN